MHVIYLQKEFSSVMETQFLWAKTDHLSHYVHISFVHVNQLNFSQNPCIIINFQYLGMMTDSHCLQVIKALNYDGKTVKTEGKI